MEALVMSAFCKGNVKGHFRENTVLANFLPRECYGVAASLSL